jgi:hypothetical protein
MIVLSIEDRILANLLLLWNAILNFFTPPVHPPSLDEDGYCLLESNLDTVPTTILSVLPRGYVLLNNTHTRRGGSNPFYWRSSTFFKATTYPTYLAIHYEHPGPALSVSNGSHLGWQMSLPTQVNAQQNTLILMNSGLLKAHIDTSPQTTTQFLVVHQQDSYLFDQQTHTESIYIPTFPFTALIPQILSYLVAVPVQGVAMFGWTVRQFIKEKYA